MLFARHFYRLPIVLLLVLGALSLTFAGLRHPALANEPGDESALAHGISAGFDGMIAYRLPPLGEADAAPKDVRIRQLTIESVIGSDDRWPETSTTSSPYRSIAYLESWYSTYLASCTGTFIGAQVVLTAAHCLYDSNDGWPERVKVVPGRNGGDSPFGYEYGSNVYVPSRWYNYEDTYYDYGLIQLSSTSLGSAVGWLTLAVLPNNILQSSSLRPTITGYPGDKPPGTMWSGSATSLRSVSSNSLTYTIDTFGGQSGSGVRRADNKIVGVHVQGSSSYNRANRVTEAMVSNLSGICSSPECNFSSWTYVPLNYSANVGTVRKNY